MLKHLLPLLSGICLSLVACNTPTDVLPDSPSELITETDPFFISPEAARDHLNQALDILDTPTRSLARRSEERPAATIFPSERSRSAADAEPLFYVFNIEGGGFALVSTDSRTSPVYAVTDEGRYSPDLENPNFALFLEGAERAYKEEIEQTELFIKEWIADQAAQAAPKRQVHIEIPPSPTEWTWKAPIAKVAPLLKTKWGQGAPYNNDCKPITGGNGERSATGCTVTAFCQVVAFHRYPNNFGKTIFHWDEMLRSPKIPDDGSIAATDVAALHALARRNDFIGGTSDEASGASFTRIAYALINLQYPYETSKNLIDLKQDTPLNSYLNSITSSLDNNAPVPIGAATEDGKGAPHSWVIDGYATQEGQRTIYISGYPYPATQSMTRTLIHCNWGWDGLCDGYFLPSFLHPKQGNIQPDPDSDTSIRIDSEYSWDFKLFVNIKPA